MSRIGDLTVPAVGRVPPDNGISLEDVFTFILGCVVDDWAGHLLGNRLQQLVGMLLPPNGCLWAHSCASESAGTEGHEEITEELHAVAEPLGLLSLEPWPAQDCAESSRNNPAAPATLLLLKFEDCRAAAVSDASGIDCLCAHLSHRSLAGLL
eukprot:SAG31_NODE_11743_length_1002_cov_0.863787_2_plen_153_part_00